MSSFIAAAPPTPTRHQSDPSIASIPCSVQRTGDSPGPARTCACAGFSWAVPPAAHPGGEGLQHQDGHSHLLAANIPTCVAYDPTFAYEWQSSCRTDCAAWSRSRRTFLLHHHDERNYTHPAMPRVWRRDPQRFVLAARKSCARTGSVQLLAQAILREVIAAADCWRAISPSAQTCECPISPNCGARTGGRSCRCCIPSSRAGELRRDLSGQSQGPGGATDYVAPVCRQIPTLLV